MSECTRCSLSSDSGYTSMSQLKLNFTCVGADVWLTSSDSRRSSVSSTWTTASAPHGIGAPVVTLITWPGITVWVGCTQTSIENVKEGKLVTQTWASVSDKFWRRIEKKRFPSLFSRSEAKALMEKTDVYKLLSMTECMKCTFSH